METKPSSSSSLGINDFAEILFRHKKKALFVPLVILALGTLLILFSPREYWSEAKISLQVGRESVKLDPTATTIDSMTMMQNDRSNEINTAVDMLKSRGLISKVVEELGPDVVLGKTEAGEQETNAAVAFVNEQLTKLILLLKSIDPISPTEAAIVSIERNLDVEAEQDSTLIAVRVEAETPELAQLIVGSLIDNYQKEHLRMHRTSGSKAFFTEQYDSLQQQLDESVDALRLAKNRLNMVSIESRRGTLENRLAQLELSRYQNLEQLAGAQAKVAALEEQLDSVPERMIAAETTGPNTGTDMLRAQLYALQVKMMDQQAKYSEDHPELQATRAQLAEAAALVEQEAAERQEHVSDLNPNHQALALSLAQAESEQASLEAQRAELAELLKRVGNDLHQLNDNELEIDRLERTSSLARTNYYRYAENLEKARIDEALDKGRISNVIVAQEATLAEKPVSPNKLVLGALTLMLAGCSAASALLIGEKANNRIYNEEQLERSLRIPVLASIPKNRKLAKLAT